MRPLVRMLDDAVLGRILDEAAALLRSPGVLVHNAQALELLHDHGSDVDRATSVARIPNTLVERALQVAARAFDLFTLDGRPVVHYGGDAIHFDPGSAALTILDPRSDEERPAVTADFVRLVKLVEQLPPLDAQSTALVCADVAPDIADLYRLYLALVTGRKPVVTGAFRIETWHTMRALLVAAAGGEQALRERPIAVFDVCPSPPLLWSDLTCQNLIDCARAGIPAQIVSMPMAGATAPVTLAAAVVQHTAECLSGLVIAQLACPGAAVVWGGSPAAFDMREGTTPMGDVGTWMIDSAYAQVGKHLGLPTHAYLGMSDAKRLDFQCGMESGASTVMAALSGINMISGAGMMDFETCQSLEKLVCDAEMIGMAKRLVRGVEAHEDPIALGLFERLGHRADYLSDPHTLKWFARELYLPSPLIDRRSHDSWKRSGATTTAQRAAERVEALVKKYPGPTTPAPLRAELRAITRDAARAAGMSDLPAIDEDLL